MAWTRPLHSQWGPAGVSHPFPVKEQSFGVHRAALDCHLSLHQRVPTLLPEILVGLPLPLNELNSLCSNSIRFRLTHGPVALWD